MGQPRAPHPTAPPWWSQPPVQGLAHSAPQHMRPAATGQSQLPGGRHSARVAPLTIPLANSVRGCIHAGKSLQALHRQGDGQRNLNSQGHLC